MTGPGDDLLRRARDGDAAAVGRLITLAERGQLDESVVRRWVGDSRAPHVVGFTGAPGVGKSTALAEFTRHWLALGRRVAILAVDPSSHRTGGAVLGDRARMGAHALDRDVYIRSLAARGRLGGLADAVPLAAQILTGAGYDIIAVETVGVGQSETDVSAAVDTTCVLLAPGMGDGLQAVKAGIMEIGEVFVVTKSDLSGAANVARAVRSLAAAQRPDGWRPAVVQTSATDGTGFGEAIKAIDAHLEFVLTHDLRRAKALEHARERVLQAACNSLRQDLESSLGHLLDEHVRTVADGTVPADAAARDLVSQWRRT